LPTFQLLTAGFLASPLQTPDLYDGVGEIGEGSCNLKTIGTTSVATNTSSRLSSAVQAPGAVVSTGRHPDIVGTRRMLGRLFFCILFLTAVFATRIPFLSNELVGEEGDFAFLIANPTPSSELSTDGLPNILIANLDGVYALNTIEHGVMPYVFLERVPGTIVRAMGVLSMPPVTRIIVVRAAYLSLFLLGVVGLAWLVARPPQGGRVGDFLLLVLIPFYALTTPLAVGGSIQPQIDGGFGVLTVGVAATLLLPSPGRAAHALRWLIAGVVVGLGRAEWTLAFAGVSGAVLLAAIAMKTPKSVCWLCLALLAGLSMGVAISCAVSPADYAGNFSVARRVFGYASQWMIACRERQYVIPLCALLAAVVVASLRDIGSRLREAPGLLIVAGSGAIIFLGFAASGFSGDGFPRYYSPALALTAYAATWLALADARVWPLALKGGLTVLLLAGLVANVNYLAGANRAHASITSGPGQRLPLATASYAAAAERAKHDNVLTLQGSGIWLTHPDVRFIAADMGYPGAVNYLARNYPDWSWRLEPEK
jgi:hypothetical protein